MIRARRYDRKQRKMVAIEQPYLVNQYNKYMGGVDLFDNAMNKQLSHSSSGQKVVLAISYKRFRWAMVNAWKLHCFCRKFEKTPKCLNLILEWKYAR